MKFFDTIKSSIAFVKPYFGFSRPNLSKTLTLIASFLTPILEVVVVNIGNKFVLREEREEQSELDINDRVNLFVTGFVLFSLSYSIRYSLDRYLIESLKKSIKIDHTNKLLNKNDKFLIGSSVVENPIVSLQEVTIGNRIDTFVESFVPTIITQSGEMISICANLYYMSQATKSFSAPTYALTFAIFAGGINFKLDKLIASYTNDELETSSMLLSRTAFTESNKDSITLTGGLRFEQNLITEKLKLREEQTASFAKTVFASTFANLVLVNSAVCFFDVLLPSHLIKSNTKYLNNLTAMLTVSSQRLAEIYNKKYPQLGANLDTLEAFIVSYEKWIKLTGSNYLLQSFESKSLILKDFSVSFSNNITYDNSVLYNVNLHLKPAVYRLLGESGCGKTTILKALVNCWPFVKGQIDYPSAEENICFIPQKICIPPKATLMEIMLYPRLFNSFLEKIEDKVVISIMNELGISKYNDALYSRKINWEAILSGGEKQKIAIIGAILKHPDLLILDEVAANLDESSKNTAYRIIKHYLPKTTIIYIDHRPVKTIEDYTLEIIDHNLQVNYVGDVSDY